MLALCEGTRVAERAVEACVLGAKVVFVDGSLRRRGSRFASSL